MAKLSKLLSSPTSPLLRHAGADHEEENSKGGWKGLFGSGARSSSSSNKSSSGGSSNRSAVPDALGYYALLGLKAPPPSSISWTTGGSGTSALTPEQVKAAYRKAAMSLHPDRYNSVVLTSAGSAESSDESGGAGGGPGGESQAEWEARWRRVQAAYEVLKDPAQKKLYDQGRLEELERLTGQYSVQVP